MFSPDGYRALVEGAGVLERSERGRLRLTGADRRTYLQGILTNDIAALTSGTGCYAAMLTPNGRMITDMRVLELGDSVLVDLDRALAPAIHERLDQFIFAEDVVVSDESASLVQVGLYGPRAAAILAQALAELRAAGGDVPDASRLSSLRPFENVRVDAGAPAIVAACDDFGIAGFEVFLESPAADALSRALIARGAVPVNRETAEVTRVEAGRPLFGVDMDQDTIPLEAGIEDRAISHTKGCYVGQEIIIRVLHRGHGRVARKLVGLTIDGPVPARGDRISAGDRETGTITSAVHSPVLGRTIALGYVRRDHAEPGTHVAIAGPEGPVPATVVTTPLVHRATDHLS
jgi:folate-binding protein YgfZ